MVEGDRFQTPATNQEIAEQVFLSVDAVKAHLRTLYRKFAIEDLPHNRKRARLVELAIAAGYVGGEADGGEERSPAATPPPPAAPAGQPASGWASRRWLAVAVLVAAAAVLAALAVSGVFSAGEGPSGADVAAYRSAVRGYCRLALSGAETGGSGSRARRAAAYLEVIETMRGRLRSLDPPVAANRALERFRGGLTKAANFNSVVAQHPPPAGSPAESNVVAELTFAAGQVQAGALGYDLGPDCLQIGDLIASSARNAAAPALP